MSHEVTTGDLITAAQFNAAQKPVLLQKVTLGEAGSILLDEVESGFSELLVKYDVCSDRADTNDSMQIEFDGDTIGTNYTRQFLYASNGSVSSQKADTNTVAFVSAANSPANARGHGKISIIGYDETDTIKSAVSEFVHLNSPGNIRGGSILVIHEDGSTDAIDTSVAIKAQAGDLIAGSWAELWGY